MRKEAIPTFVGWVWPPIFAYFRFLLPFAVGVIRPRLSALADRAFHMSPLDTRQGKDLMGSFIADLVLQCPLWHSQS